MSLAPALLLDTYSIPRTTAAAGTAFTQFVPPRRANKAKISFLQITSGATAHTYYLMREMSRVKAVQPVGATPSNIAAAAGATTLTVLQDPGVYTALPEWLRMGSLALSVANSPLSTSMYVVIQLLDGTFTVQKPSAVSVNSTNGNLTMTISALPAPVAVGAFVWNMGAPGQQNPHDNITPTTLLPTVSVTNTYPAAAAVGGGTVIDAFSANSPILLYNANATAASSIDYGTAVYQFVGP